MTKTRQQNKGKRTGMKVDFQHAFLESNNSMQSSWKQNLRIENTGQVLKRINSSKNCPFKGWIERKNNKSRRERELLTKPNSNTCPAKHPKENSSSCFNTHPELQN